MTNVRALPIATVEIGCRFAGGVDTREDVLRAYRQDGCDGQPESGRAAAPATKRDGLRAFNKIELSWV